jgi:glucose-6-phosphate isomerase
MKGAQAAAKDLSADDLEHNFAYQYAAIMYIPADELHLHGHLEPASRRMRPILTEADPLVN